MMITRLTKREIEESSAYLLRKAAAEYEIVNSIVRTYIAEGHLVFVIENSQGRAVGLIKEIMLLFATHGHDYAAVRKIMQATARGTAKKFLLEQRRPAMPTALELIAKIVEEYDSMMSSPPAMRGGMPSIEEARKLLPEKTAEPQPKEKTRTPGTMPD